MTPFTHAARDFALAQHIGRKAIIRKELETYNLGSWLYRHVELNPQCNYLSATAEMAVLSLDKPTALRLIRQCWAYWKEVPLARWSNPDATRKHHLDCLKTLYHGEARKLLSPKAVGGLVTGAAAE